MYTFFKKKTIAYYEGYKESLLKMETHTMFLFGKTQFQDMSISKNLTSKFNIIPIKIPPEFFFSNLDFYATWEIDWNANGRVNI